MLKITIELDAITPTALLTVTDCNRKVGTPRAYPGTRWAAHELHQALEGLAGVTTHGDRGSEIALELRGDAALGNLMTYLIMSWHAEVRVVRSGFQG